MSSMEHSYRLDIYTADGRFVRHLTEAEPGWSLEGNVDARVRWSGKATCHLSGASSLEYADTATGLTWMVCRIHAWIIVDGAEHRLGVFRAKPLTGAHSLGGDTLELSFFDLLSIPADDYYRDTFSTQTGQGTILEAVWAVLKSSGVHASSWSPTRDGDVPMPRAMTFETKTPKLTIINELLEALGYFALYTNRDGVFVARPYVAPKARPIVYRFSPHEGATHVPAFQWDQDLDIPNRVIAYSQESSDLPMMSAVATNEDPSSPYSYQGQGVWVTKIYDAVQAASQSVLDAYAARMLASSTNAGLTFRRELAFHPAIELNAVCADSGGSLEVVEKIGLTATPGALMSVETRRVAS